MRFYALLLAMLTAGCATITKGTDQQVAIDTPSYPGAQCTLSSKSIGVKHVVTPAVITLPLSRFDVAVSCETQCASGTGIIASRIQGMTAGNLIVGGVVGLGVDAATGAMNKYDSQNQIILQKTC